MTRASLDRQKSQRWLLITGLLFAGFAALLWYIHWYHDGGMQTNDTASGLALIACLISLLALIRYLTILEDRRLLLVGVALFMAGLLVFLFDRVLDAHYYQIFAATRGKSLEAYDSRYLTNYLIFFVTPFILMLEAALFALSLTAFITLAFRKLRLRGKSLSQADIAGA